MSRLDQLAIGWCVLWSIVAFLAFGFDKWRAGRAGRRVPELTLLVLSALGGWPGGGLGMIVFRHKTAKWSFKLKFALALIPFATGVWAWWHWR
jgi:uncharacterized membrane protein YsdA (DUF1294 family)